MKIKLNENEVYEIKLPAEIGIEELDMITARFNSLLKNFSKISMVYPSTDIIIPTNQIRKYRKKTNNWSILKENRELFIELLNTYYNKSPSEFESFKEQNDFNMSRAEMSNIAVIRLKELHNVNPNEIGLIKYPTKTEPIGMVRLNNSEDKIENKYEVGIIHYNLNGKYGCNPSVNSSESKLSYDFNKITCDNCKRLFGEK